DGCENRNQKTIKDFFFENVIITQLSHKTTPLSAIPKVASINENSPSTEQRERTEQIDSLLHENPGDFIDCRLIINGVCIRSEMEKWRQLSKCEEELHKQDTIEQILTPSETQLASSTGATYQDTENDGQPEEVKQYTKDITANVVNGP
ncbi:14682_t:CDS:2, partial [Racocetra fulgida]